MVRTATEWQFVQGWDVNNRTAEDRTEDRNKSYNIMKILADINLKAIFIKSALTVQLFVAYIVAFAELQVIRAVRQ